MKRALTLCTLGMLIMLGLSGCIPYHLQETPRVTGVVASSTGKTPVAHAKLHYTTFPSVIVTTSTNGTFDFPPIYRWELVLVGEDRLYMLHLRAEASGYKSEELQFQVGGYDLTNQVIYLPPD